MKYIAITDHNDFEFENGKFELDIEKYYEYMSKKKLEYGEKISIYRGSFITLNGEVDKDGCETGWLLKFAASDCLKANKKYPKFWESGVWKLKAKKEYNLFTAYNAGKIILKFNVNGDNSIMFKCGDITKQINVKNLNLNDWNYIAFEMSPISVRFLIINSEFSTGEKRIIDRILIDEKLPINIKTFSIDSAALNNVRLGFNMTNIRLFENEYEFGDAYKQDMYSQVVRNASKLILVDTPKPANDMSFVSPIR